MHTHMHTCTPTCTPTCTHAHPHGTCIHTARPSLMSLRRLAFTALDITPRPSGEPADTQWVLHRMIKPQPPRIDLRQFKHLSLEQIACHPCYKCLFASIIFPSILSDAIGNNATCHCLYTRPHTRVPRG